jgi:hypothetical protein
MRQPWTKQPDLRRFFERYFESMRALFLVFLFFLVLKPAFGQDAAAPDQPLGEYPRKYSEIGIGAGEFLPFGIFGVRNDYPAIWARYGHNLGTWRVDWVFHHVSAEGVTWYNLSIGLGGIMDLYDITRVAFYIGPSLNYYKGLPTTLRELPWTFSTGMHVGMSPIVLVAGPVYFRGDFQMNFGPGQSLYAGLGFSYLY